MIASILIICQFMLMPVVVFGATFLVFLSIYNYVALPNDEAFIIHPAERLNNGEIPYKDFTRTYPPSRLYALLVVFKIFGVNFRSAKLWFLTAYSTLAMLLYFVSQTVISNFFISIIPFILLLVYVFPPKKSYWPVYVYSSMHADRLLPAFFIILIFAFYLKTKIFLFLVVIGFLLGLSFSFSQEIAIFINTSYYIALFFRGGAIFDEVKFSVLGFLMALLFMYIYLKAKGISIKSVWLYALKDIFTFIKHTKLPYPEFIRNNNLKAVYENLFTLRFYLPWIIYSLTLLFLLYKRIFLTLSTYDLVAFFVLLFGIFFLSYLIQRADYEHLPVTLVPYYVIYGYVINNLYEFVTISHSTGTYTIYFFICLYLLLALVILFFYDIICGLKSYIIHSNEMEDKVFLERERGQTLFDNEYLLHILPVCDFIEKNTGVNDCIFVAISEPVIYFLTKRKNPTRILSILPQMKDIDIKDIIYDLKKYKPKMVIYNKDHVEHSYQNQMHLKEYANELYKFIWQNYKVYERIDRYLILRIVTK